MKQKALLVQQKWMVGFLVLWFVLALVVSFLNPQASNVRIVRLVLAVIDFVVAIALPLVLWRRQRQSKERLSWRLWLASALPLLYSLIIFVINLVFDLTHAI